MARVSLALALSYCETAAERERVLERFQRVELAAVEAFKRGVRFRDTTNAPLPSDEEIIAKLDEASNDR